MSNVMVEGLLSSLLGKYTVKDLEYMVSINADMSVMLQQYAASQLMLIRMMNSISKYQISEHETLEYLRLNYQNLYKYLATNSNARLWLRNNLVRINRIIV